MNFNCLRVVLVQIFICAVYSSKLNVPRVLLPVFNDFSSKFTLEATEGGCYKWTTTRSDIISLHPIDVHNDCSSKVLVQTITKQRTRNIAVVLAEDVDTEQVLRCDVIVDVIETLSIVTTTKELFMDEAPEAFEVRAYDKQDNEFTSLEGVELDWQLTCLGPQKDATVIRFITFKESPYETPPTVVELEQNDKKGHIVLLEGVKTGSAEVSVKFLQLEYKHIEPVEVVLTVIANLLILPPDAYVMTGDTLEFQIIQLNNGRMDRLTLPDPEYYLQSEDENIALADSKSGEVTALALGFTKIVLRNRNMDTIEDITVKLPAARVTIVAPAYMTVTLLPHKNWITLLSEHHDIVAEVYSSENQKIHIGNNVQIHTQVGEIFHVQQRSYNGSWLTGWTKQEGIAKVQAVLESIVSKNHGVIKIKPDIQATAELLVYPLIVLTPSVVILPWDGKKKPKYKVDIEATGGDEEFLWSSNNHSVGVVTQTGNVRTQSFGTFEVSAAMMKNHHNRGSATFHVLSPTRLEIVEFAMEAEVGAFIYLHIALYTELFPKSNAQHSEILFTSCQELQFKVKSSNSNFYYNKSATISPIGISCGNVAIIGAQVGVSKISVSLHIEDLILEDSVTVSTFKPLQLLYPQSYQIVLAVGASTNLLFTGGPRPVVGRPTSHIRKVTIEDSATVAAQDVTNKLLPSEQQSHIVLNVLCLRLGDSDVELTVENTPLLSNCKNQGGILTVGVICGKPRSVILQPAIYTEARSCPMDLNSQRVVVQSKKDIELTVTVIDETGLPFLNISTLMFDWTVKPIGLAVAGIHNAIFQRNVTENDVVVANRSYQIISPKGDRGVIFVSAQIIGYHMEKLLAAKISREYPEFVTDDDFEKEIIPPLGEIELYLVSDVEVTPSVISIFNHPENIKKLPVIQGSGHFELVNSEAEIAEVNYLENTKEIEIVPKKDGELKLRLTDLCLVSKPCNIDVEVVSVRTIRVEMSDKVEVGKCISCIVRIYDASDNLVDIPNLKFLDLNVNLEDDIAKFKILPEEGSSRPAGEIHYVVTGMELGDTTVTFSVNEVRSSPLNLQVFPPLKIYPRNTTLLIGSVLQLSAKGGPQPDANMEYFLSRSDIADVSNIGLLQGIAFGHTKVSARAVGVNPTTGAKVIYSNDTVDLYVVSIDGIKISMPLTRFRVGAVVPAWCSGFPEQLSPVILGSISPPIRFEWEVQYGEIIRMHTPLEKFGIEYLPEDNVAVRITGLKPGRSSLQLTAKIDGIAAKQPKRPKFVFSTNIDIEVFEHLVLTSPIRLPDSSILMAPQSSTQLQTNLDTVNKIHYSLLSSHGLSTENEHVLDKSLSIPNPIVTLSDSGLLESHDIVGRVMIVVSARDDYGLKQTLSLIVEVKPIYYMLLHVAADWRIGTANAGNSVPLGTDLQLQATYHDNTGAIFTVGAASLGLRTSRFDLTRIHLGNDNSSILVSIKKPGSNVIKVWADGLHKTADYIKLNIGQLISPALDYLVTGDIVCMWTPVTSSTEQVSRWSANNNKLLTLDAETGIGQVTSIKEGRVVITHTLHPSASLHLKVFPATQILMIPKADNTLTNALSTKVYRIPLILTTSVSTRSRNLLNGWPCQAEVQASIINYPFTCHMEFVNSSLSTHALAVFSIVGGFDSAIGQYTCDIHPINTKNPNISTLYSSISVWAELEGTNVESKPIDIRFIPSIYVENELTLDEQYKANLIIYGTEDVLDNVMVRAADQHLLEVEEAYRPESYILSHTITLIDYHWKLIELADPLSLVVTSKLTDEVIKVYVKLVGNADLFEKCPAGSNHSPVISFFNEYRNLLIIIISLLAIFFITCYAYSHYMQPVINVNVSTDRTLLSGSPRSFGSKSSLQYSPENSCNPCTTRRYLQMPQSPASGVRNASLTNREPVFGDPSSFYSTSPEIRRNRRFM